MTDRNTISQVIESLFVDWIDKNINVRPLAVENMRILEADALFLLKEKEAKEVEAEVINEIDRLYRCPSCHISMILRGQPYCHSCGQAVKWG